MSKYTPGPWTSDIFLGTDDHIQELRKHGMEPTQALTNDGSRFVMAGEQRVALVDCQSKYKRGEGYKAQCAERDANARLIKAAPDLLEVLQEVAADSICMKGFHEQFRTRIRAAIAKATV